MARRSLCGFLATGATQAEGGGERCRLDSANTHALCRVPALYRLGWLASDAGVLGRGYLVVRHDRGLIRSHRSGWHRHTIEKRFLQATSLQGIDADRELIGPLPCAKVCSRWHASKRCRKCPRSAWLYCWGRRGRPCPCPA